MCTSGIAVDGVEAVDWSYGGDKDGKKSEERLRFADHEARGVANAPSGRAPKCARGEVLVAGACAAVAAGYYAPQEGMTEGIQCQPGSFSISTGAEVCTACPIGEFQANYAATACEPCALGEFSAATGAVACVKCPPGEFMDDVGGGRCKKCAIGTYASGTGESSCRSCGLDFVDQAVTTYETGSVGKADCVCKSGYYRDNEDLCQECGKGLFCPEGSHIQGIGEHMWDEGVKKPTNVSVRMGYWVEDGAHLHEVHQCATVVQTDYLQAHQLETGWITDESVASRRCKGFLPGGAGCAAQRGGHLCGRCEPGFFRGEDQTCMDCEERANNVTMWLVCLLIIIVLLPFAAYKVFNSGASEYAFLGGFV